MNRQVLPSSRWALVLSLTLVIGGFFVLGCADSQPPAKAAEPPKSPEQGKDADPTKPADQGKAADKPAEPARPAEASKAVESGKPAEQPKDRRALLETVGALTASHCYQTYLNIGLVADAKARGTYSEKDAYKILESVLSLLDTVDRKLADLTKFDLDGRDRESLEQMRKLSRLLHDQGKALETSWDTGRPEDTGKYENVRKDSWAAISKLLGLEK
jgi:hypothetical protein